MDCRQKTLYVISGNTWMVGKYSLMLPKTMEDFRPTALVWAVVSCFSSGIWQITSNVNLKKKHCGKQLLVQLHLMQALYLVTVSLKAVKEENCLLMGYNWFYLKQERSLWPKSTFYFVASFCICLILFPHTLSAFWLKLGRESQSEHFTPCLHKEFILLEKPPSWSKCNYLCKKRSTGAVLLCDYNA